MPLGSSISSLRNLFQEEIVPLVEEQLGRASKRHGRLVAVLDRVKVETFIRAVPVRAGRPLSDQAALASTFIAKAIWNLATTREVIDRIHADAVLRRLCGWSRRREVPSESTFSRAFAEFARGDLPGRMHEALIRATLGRDDVIVGHLSRDSTAIEVRKKPHKPRKDGNREKAVKRGRPRQGESKPDPDKKRLDRQLTMTLPEMLEDLPRRCRVGTRSNARGYRTSWPGYKLHLDAADGGIPVSCILTSASLHDSQVAIPLATISHQRVHSPYDLMDSACDAPQIRTRSESPGHVPIIDVNPRRNRELKSALRAEARARRTAGILDAQTIRYRERSTVERVYGRLKDEFGARHVRVRGPTRVACHLMRGILALTVDPLLRLGT